jgi:predicted DNA repair protein MutK
MIWVGGGILVHGLEVLGFPPIAHFIHHLAETIGHAAGRAGPIAAWTAGAIGSGLFGLVVGGAIAWIGHKFRH